MNALLLVTHLVVGKVLKAAQSEAPRVDKGQGCIMRDRAEVINRKPLGCVSRSRFRTESPRCPAIPAVSSLTFSLQRAQKGLSSSVIGI